MDAIDNSLHLPVAPTQQKKGKEQRAADALLVAPLRDPYEMERAELEAYLQSTEYFSTKTSLLEFARRYNVPVNARTQREEIIRLCLRMIHDIPASFAGLSAAKRTPGSSPPVGTATRQVLADFFVETKGDGQAEERDNKKLSTNLLDGILRCHEVGLLLAHIRGADAEMFLQILEACESPVETHVRFLSNLVDFARLEAGKYEFARTPFRLRDCIGEALKRLAFSAHQKQLELCYEVQEDVPERVVGDPARLQQVLINLVDNAIKFTEHGEIVIEVKKEDVSEQTTSPVAAELSGPEAESFLLRFFVRDTGVGAPKEQVQALTQLFSAGGKSARPPLLGLGLPIAHRFVQAMGRSMTISSKPQHGSVCSFSVRLHNDKANGGGATTHLNALRRRRILIVEDNASYRRILHDLLSSWGAQPYLAASGREALAALYKQSDEPFAAILFDGHLTDMEGFASIRRQHLAEDLTLVSPMLMMLASTDPVREMERHRELHVAAFLQKPITPAELLQALLEALASGAPSPEEEVLDRAALWSLVAGDTQLLKELIGLFEYDCARWFFALQHAIITENCRDVVVAAHALKGTVSAFAARGVLRVLAVIDNFGEQGDLAHAQEAMLQLTAELSRLKIALDDLGRELSRASTGKEF